MITKEEYLKACEIVAKYHLDIKHEIIYVEKERVLVVDWAHKHSDEMSSRLMIRLKFSGIRFMDEIPLNMKLFCRIASGIGKKTAIEFFELLEKYPY